MPRHPARALAVAAALLAAAAGPARAQTSDAYTVAPAADEYEPLAAGTVLFTDSDDGFAEVALPFPFALFGQEYERVWVSVNGGVTFQGRDPVTGAAWPLPGINQRLPSQQQPQALLAALWDDWQATPLAPGGGSAVKWGVAGAAPDRRFVVDWQRVQPYGATGAGQPAFSFQLLLHERTFEYEVRFGPQEGAGALAMSATSGCENRVGTRGFAHLECNPACGPGDAPPLAGLRVSPNLNPELTAEIEFAGARDGGPVLGVRLRNSGNSAAPDVRYRVWLSADAVTDAGDTLVADAAVSSIAAVDGQADREIVPALAPALRGAWYAIVRVDPDNAIFELNEGDNEAVLATPFYAGPELTAAVRGTRSLVAGEPAVVRATVVNKGVAPAAGVRVAVLFRGEKLGAETLTGYTSEPFDAPAQSETERALQFTVPAALPAGSYSLDILADSQLAITETDETNNLAAFPLPVEVRGPDPAVLAVAAGAERVARGGVLPVRVTIQNLGLARAADFSAGIFLSANDTITLRDRQVYSSAPFTLLGGEKRTLTVPASIPADLAPGLWYLGVIADAEGRVLDTDTRNNVRAGTQVLVTLPAGDPAVLSADAGGAVVAGESLLVSAVVANLGSEPCTVPWTTHLSANDTISGTDRKLGGGSLTLPAGAQRTVWLDAPVPADLRPGLWRAGVRIDTAVAAAGNETWNDAAAAPQPVEVRAATLAISTEALPGAAVGLAYSVQLDARGGTAPYTWALAAGALPAGLSLSASGVVSGTPTAPGLAAPVFAATSAGTTVHRTLTLEVSEHAASLGVLDTVLPPARRGVFYSWDIGAAGGTEPYAYAATGLPPGLILSPTGALTGVPTVAGRYELALRLDDAAAHRAETKLRLDVLAEGPLNVRPPRDVPWLPTAEAGRPWAATFTVEGGLPPYEVRVERGRLPAGLALELSESGVTASLEGTPTETGTYSFSVELSDSRGELDLAQVMLRVMPRPLSFVTTSLPAAVPGEPYTATIETNARPPATWAVVAGALPPGLFLEDGTISGTVGASAAPRPWPFAVRVRDASGGEATAAFAIDVPVPAPATPADEGGCASTAAGLPALGLLLAAGLLARRRRGAALAALLALSLPAAPALAQYKVIREVSPYEPLSTGTDSDATTALDASSTAKSKLLTLPFSFRYYGSFFTTVGVSRYGVLSFGAADETSSNEIPPSPKNPNQALMPWWDLMKISADTPDGPGSIRWEVEGEEPNRAFVVEWKNLQYDSASYSGRNYAAFSFQVRLHETTNEITIHYGGEAAVSGQVPTVTASMGMEGPGGLSGLDLSDSGCGSTCRAGDFPVDTRYRLRLAPDLSLAKPVVARDVPRNVPVTARVEIRNTGLVEARLATVRCVLSADSLPDVADVVVGQSSPVTVPAEGTATVTLRLLVPESAPVGLAWLVAIVDLANDIEETDEDNNVAEAAQIAVESAAPDFQAARLQAPDLVDAGTDFLVTRTVRNAGLASGAGTWRLVLSDNALVSGADATLASGTFDLDAGEALDATAPARVPAGTAPGRYWLGLVVRPATGTVEPDPLDNDLAFGPVLVRGGALAVATQTLPTVRAGTPFSLQLTAVGGRGAPAWAAGDPPLPTGVVLSAAGQLAGRLDGAGQWTFQVRVQSEGETASRTLTLEAVGGTTALELVSRRLSLCTAGVACAARLVARGGTPPYAWSLESGSTLPDGLAMSPDGVVEGVTLADGLHTLRATVRDSASTPATATGEVVLPVAGPARPLFATTALPAATPGEALSVQLHAGGGTPPYRFSIVDSRRVAVEPGDPGTVYPAAAPPGLTLTTEGLLSGTPTEAGRFAIQVRVVDAASRDDVAALPLVVAGPSDLAVTTVSLPDARADQPYTASLAATGGSGTYTWQFEFADAEATPPGLLFSANGVISGRPTTTGVWAFLALVKDAEGHHAMQAVALRVREALPEETDEGCATGGAGLLGALAALGVLARRRRAGLMAALALLPAALVLAGCPAEQGSACKESCAAPLVCDELDGLCKCGAAGGAICLAGETCDADSKSCLRATCESACPAPLVCGPDGSCRCGSSTGPVCGAGEECQPAGGCAPRDVCEGVRCSAGMSCDPGAQGACRCGAGGPACAAGQRCVEAQCVADRCSGVACTGGTQCDPADGLCKCGGAGGAECTGGDACDAVNLRCLHSNRCDGVVCTGGAACDPADGRCRCAGPGGPACGAEQWCDPVARRCEGGDLCAGKTCQNGNSCDPEDGACKCGGIGGTTCATGLICIGEGTTFACRQPCDLFVSGTCGTLTCRWSEPGRTAYCAESGTARRGETCGDVQCAPGLHCVRPAGANGVCTDYCRRDSDCRPNEVCGLFYADAPAGLCSEAGN